GTLNFLRLTPQSALSILVGKLLGVPILLYLAAVLTIPLHLWLGFSAQMPGFEILAFYAVLISSCAFFYSAALLFGLVTSWLGGFQGWLGSGAVLTFLWMINFKPIAHSPMDWLHLFSLVAKLPYLQSHINDLGGDYISPVETIQELKWFDLPIGATRISLVIFALLHYALWTGWIWQALNRQFHNPNATIISKRQSYWLVACFEAVVLGFVSLEEPQEYYDLSEILRNPAWLAIFNGVLFIGLIAVLAPQRQALQDWARYRRERATGKGFWHRALVQDLLEGEKSPELLAMAVNLAIAITPFLLWIVFVPSDVIDKAKALMSVAFFVSLVMIYSTLAQLMLMMKTNKRSLWAAGTIAALVVVPPLSLSILSVDTLEQPALWLFSTFPWAGIEHGATTTMGMALLLQCCVLILLNFQLTRKLQRAGESASKALLAGCPALPN
ncbi:ABC transporter permease, partial [Allocoleopsis sp.]|uniref:ABC transporter permease n=1 Tax=Allocoleopsis sp. TaxID=3088169 RepID=UPI002FCEAC7E